MADIFSKRKRETTYIADCTIEGCSDVTVMLKKRKTTPHVDWSMLLNDLLDLILKKLPFKDKFNFRDTCLSWYSVANSHIKSLMIELNNEYPLMLMPTDFKEEEEEANKQNNYSLDLVKKLQKPLNMPANSHCIGSSQGWLILLQDKQNLLLYNPILDVEFHLPPIQSLPNFNYNPANLSRNWISKVIMWGNPVFSQYYGVAIIYDWDSKIAYTNHEARGWTLFEDSRNKYWDITVDKDYIYALCDKGSIEAWRIDCLNPTKSTNQSLSLTIPMNMSENMELYAIQHYIVESNGELLLVIRCIAENVNPDGEPIIESDEFCGGYWTKNFYVYKLDLSNKEWIEMKDLGDRMLFVGGNHSKSLSAKKYKGFKANSIYFTDDYWLRIEEDRMYGGHDMGIFDVGDKSIREIYDCKLEYRMTPAFWILQN